MPVRVPVKVRQEGGEHQGLTRDLSSFGIFLYSESGMKTGSKLELVIMLPPAWDWAWRVDALRSPRWCAWRNRKARGWRCGYHRPHRFVAEIS